MRVEKSETIIRVFIFSCFQLSGWRFLPLYLVGCLGAVTLMTATTAATTATAVVIVVFKRAIIIDNTGRRERQAVEPGETLFLPLVAESLCFSSHRFEVPSGAVQLIIVVVVAVTLVIIRALPIAAFEHGFARGFFAFWAAASPAFLSSLSLFHLANVSGVTGVSVPVNLCLSDSRKSSRVSILSGDLSIWAFSANLCSRVLSTNLERRKRRVSSRG